MQTDTRQELLRAAERLFATKGIAATRVRDVNAEAGQRNTSAVRYHFGGMDGLLGALIELRMGELDEARAHALEVVTSQPDRGAGGVRSAVEAEDYVATLVLPLAERVRDDAGWACWVRVLAQLVSVRGDAHRDVWAGRFDGSSRAVFEKLREALPDLPEPIWQQRADDLMTFCIGSLCERARKTERDGQAALPLDGPAFDANLVRVATSILQAPS